MQISYITIDGLSEAFLKEKNSKFHAYAYPVSSKEEVKHELQGLKEIYPDANHHCYAYVLGIEQKEERANDDGEPSSSAGKPILRQILSAGVTNTLVVVVRYFGGKKLGVPGLIHAYGESAKMALEAAKKIEKELQIKFLVSCPFGEENHIYRVCKRLEAQMEPRHSMTQFMTQVTLRLADKEAFVTAFKDLHKIEVKEAD